MGKSAVENLFEELERGSTILRGCLVMQKEEMEMNCEGRVRSSD